MAAVSSRTGVLPAFAAAHFTHHLCTGILIPLMPLIKISFGLDYTQSGLLVSAFSLAYGLGGPPVAWLADRMSRLTLISVGLAGVALCSIAIGLSTGYDQLVVLLILMGLLGASYHAPASSLLGSMFTARERGRALGMHLIGGSGSFLLTPVLAGTVASLLTWNWAFVVLSVPALLSAVFLKRVAGGYEAEVVKANAERPRVALSMIEISRVIGGVVILAILIQVIGSAFASFLPLFLTDVHGVDPKYAGMLAGLAVGTGVLGAPIGGALSDRLGRKPVILLSMVCAGPLIYLVSAAGNTPLLYIFIATYGVAMSMRMAPIESFIADVVPFDKRATVLAVYFFLGQETSGVATPLVGKLMDTVGAVTAFSWLAIGAMALAALALLLRRRI